MLHLDNRLHAALALLASAKSIADIGCDHGRLCVALAQQGAARVVAVDISEPSLEKARRLVRLAGVEDRVSLRVGNGTDALHAGECEALCLMGMGGSLMVKLLEAAKTPLCGAHFVVLQPQSAQEDLRRYLYENNYHILNDCVVKEGRRLYQIIKAAPRSEPQALPPGFPIDCFCVGYMSVMQKEPLLPELLERQQSLAERRLAQARGTVGEAKFVKQLNDIRRIQCIFKNFVP